MQKCERAVPRTSSLHCTEGEGKWEDPSETDKRVERNLGQIREHYGRRETQGGRDTKLKRNEVIRLS